MASLNPCRCGNNPERVTTSSGLVRISCVLSKCPDLVCLRSGVAERAWNEANPSDDAPTLRQNEVPKRWDAEPYNGPISTLGVWWEPPVAYNANRVSKMAVNKAQSGSMWNSGTALSDDKAEILGRLSKAPLTREIDVELPDWGEV